jgi:RNA polymerase sigma-70 factor, ECF subfamily
MDRTDEQLLAAFAGGERAALGELADRHERALLGLARGLVGSRSAACDAVQEAWVRVIRHAKGFRGQSTVKTWLYRIVINECSEVRKRLGRERNRAEALGSMLPAGADQEAPVNGGDDDVRQAVDSLEESRRVVVLLCYSAGMTHEIAAEILGLPVGTLKSRLHAALTTLRRRLAEGVTT